MALKIKINTSFNPAYLNKLIGLSHNNGWLYLKITQQSGNAERCSINVGCFVCSEINNTEGGSINNIEACIDNACYSFVPKMTGDNFIKQGYDYLKTLPEFAGCVDC